MIEAKKVKLESGFVGFVLSPEWFLIGSEVEAFEKIPSNAKELIETQRVTGKVSEIYETVRVLKKR
jgi:hypothetical protein